MTGDPHHARIPPPAFLAGPAPAAVLAALPGARAVGGCVRDALAGRDVHDVDVAAPLPPEEIARLLQAAGLKVFETGLKHGTVTAVLGGVPVEVTALRRDVATDGRHAEVEWTTDWREDAARRDFTINAMSLDAVGRLWDYFGGREDLAAGRVRFVGDAATRLAEDYLRALRFFRFLARYGRGEPDPAALAAIRDAVPGLAARIAPERIWMELKRLLEAPDPTGAVGLMRETGLLAAVLPEAGDGAALDRLVAIGAPADPLLRLAALVPEPLGIAARLRLSREEAAQLYRFSVLAFYPSNPDDVPALRAWLAERDKARALDELWLAEARDGVDRSALRAAVAAMEQPVFPLQGRDLLALGLTPGPAVGEMLAAIRAWWLENGAGPDRDACLTEARRRLGG
ncbi:CCA tRNA nucleotidyltransferase [Falsiroseomonas sp. HW251]|uniref:CCA tRNA nucleotidyltransferase n=1 Tax=Falsiroseomonas sp. HW251 TaxID=3390998 RepID=UPI003D31B07E